MRCWGWQFQEQQRRNGKALDFCCFAHSHPFSVWQILHETLFKWKLEDWYLWLTGQGWWLGLLLLLFIEHFTDSNEIIASETWLHTHSIQIKGRIEWWLLPLISCVLLTPQENLFSLTLTYLVSQHFYSGRAIFHRPVSRNVRSSRENGIMSIRREC